MHTYLDIFSQHNCDTTGSKYEYSMLAACSKVPSASGSVGKLRDPGFMGYLLARNLQIARDSNNLLSSISIAGILVKGWWSCMQSNDCVGRSV